MGYADAYLYGLPEILDLHTETTDFISSTVNKSAHIFRESSASVLAKGRQDQRSTTT